MASNKTESTIDFFSKCHGKLFLMAKYRFLIPRNILQSSNKLSLCFLCVSVIIKTSEHTDKREIQQS